MSSDYHAVLQLTGPVSAPQLQKAYQNSCQRLRRLTARGPLRFFRKDLLAEAHQAYRTLSKHSAQPDKPCPESRSGRPPQACLSPSIVARNAARRPNPADFKTPVNSPVTRRTTLSAGPDAPPVQNPDQSLCPPQRSDRASALIEDQFCRQVIHRLEGDLIRYTSRQQLLKIAHEQRIHPFRANMLIAQITEAVRQHKLYQPSPPPDTTPWPDTLDPHTPRSAKSLVALTVAAAVMIIEILAAARLAR